ncbi:sulfotransferase family protein [Limibacter armeniacum]|uniref:sulfotransferase family protein n=1 Tax=Limibacter armeniacum TaxID=466084 RepID=UPI002FE59274
MSIKVIGAGFGRTGTKSLQVALEKLGYGKCYHMEELLRNPEGVTHWQDAFKKRHVDWDKLFEGYNAIVDFPGAMYYKELAAHYPNAKVILSMRDPESWYNSAYTTIFKFEPSLGNKLKMILSLPFSQLSRNLLKVIILNKKSIWGDLFEGQFKNKEFAIQKYKAHIEEVKSTIPKERLLIFDPKDGWEPLCSFLGKEVPSEPFPRTNLKEGFHVWANNIVTDILK